MIECRKATPEDAHFIARTRRLVWQETYRGIYSDEKLDHYDVVAYTIADRERIDDPHNHYYLFMDGESCAGYFSFGPYHYGRYKDFELCINHLYIRKEYQGMGLGKYAFSVIQEYCKRNRICRFFCGCNANNLPAVAFYRHMGGKVGDHPRADVPKQDQIIHFEFYLGEETGR